MDSTRIEARTRTRELSVYGSLFFLVSSIGGSILAGGFAAPLVLLYVLAWTFLISAEAARGLKSRRFWLFLSSLTLLSPVAIGGEKDISIAGVQLSSEGMLNGMSMAIRAVTFVIATSTFAQMVSIGGLSSLFAKLGVRELGFLLGVALNLLPLVERTSANALLAMRLRGGLRRNRLRSVQKMAVTVIFNSLRYGDHVVCAAESRGFGNVQQSPIPIVVTRADRILAASSIVFYSAIMFIKLQMR